MAFKHLFHQPIIPKLLFLSLIAMALLGIINSPSALALGLCFALFFPNPYPTLTKKGIKQGLKIAIVGLGFGISIKEAITANSQGIGLLTASVFLTVILGLVLARFWGIERRLSFLVTAGTAICGGSAIAAVAPVIKANNQSVTIALAVVFSLNAIALLIFPPIGEFLELSQQQFGLWAAIAIHDTSSVVGAALAYGDEALKTATTLKLSRTLWIIPMAIFATYWFKSKGEKIAIPYFIGGFIIAILIHHFTLIPDVLSAGIVLTAKRLLVVVIFLIGTNLSLKTLKTIGLKPLLLATTLWLAISGLSLAYIML